MAVTKLFVAFVLVYRVTQCRGFICDQVLRSGQFDSKFGWNSTGCHLHDYSYGDVAECFDQLSSRLRRDGKRLRIVFVGDSRIRYAFHSFWPTLPNYDQTWTGDVVDRKFLSYHHDIEIDSPILNTRVAFLWRIRIGEGLSEFVKWASGATEAPDFLITSFSSYHMEQTLPRSYIEYEELMNQLMPVLKSLTSKTRVIWWHQNPIIETYGNKNRGVAINRSATSSKYDNYNLLAKRLLRNTGVIYWESSHQVAEEYIRSCGMNDRTDVTNLRACFDYIHNGYLVYDRGTQILLNALCNPLLSRSSNPSVLIDSNTCCYRL